MPPALRDRRASDPITRARGGWRGRPGNLASPRISVVVLLSRMGEKETTLKEVGEMLAHVVEHMATKDELAETNKELKSFRQEFNDFRDETRQNFREIQAELADIRRDLDDLRSRVANIIGYGKEIDHALERMAAIEKHLGIENKIAA